MRTRRGVSLVQAKMLNPPESPARCFGEIEELV